MFVTHCHEILSAQFDRRLDLFTCPFLVHQPAARSDHAMLIEHLLLSVFLLLDEV